MVLFFKARKTCKTPNENAIHSKIEVARNCVITEFMK
jgi:hypothetical protein